MFCDPGIDERRRKALDLLKPTAAQFEHGLELHRNCCVVDMFSFHPYAMTAGIVRKVNALIESGATAEQVTDATYEYRLLEATRDPQAREQVESAWEAAGVTGMIGNIGGGPVMDLSAHPLRFLELCDRLKPFVTQARTAADIRAAKKAGTHCHVFSTNGVPHGPLKDFETAMAPLHSAYHFGVRMMHLAYNRRNLIADGCTERNDGGLSDFGLDVVQRMNEIGIIVDTAHASRLTTLHAARASTRPIAASHVSCRSIYDHARGKTDEEIKAIAATGGVIGIYMYDPFLGTNANLLTLLEHIDHVVKLVGADHVAIGSDINYQGPMPPEVKFLPFPKSRPNYAGGWRPEHQANKTEDFRTGSLAWTNWPLITLGLVQRGYADADIERIVGGNVLRLLDAVRP